MTTQNWHGFDQHDLDRLRFLESADLSPDGKLAVYTEFSTDAEKEVDHTALWLLDVDGDGPARRLTAGTGKDGAPAFSPDGREIAFLSNRSGTMQIHVIPVGGGEARQVTKLDRGVAGQPRWSPDGRRLAFTAGPQTPARDLTRPYRVTRSIYRFDALGYLDDVKQDVYIVDAEGTQPTDARRLTGDDRMSTNPRWAPDGAGLIYVGGFDPGSIYFWPQVRYVDLEGAQRALPHPRGVVSVAAFAPDGRLVVLLNRREDRPIGSLPELYVSDRELTSFEARPTTVPGHLGGGLQGDAPAAAILPQLQFLADGRAVVSSQVGGRVPLFAIALTGPDAWEQLTPEAGECVALGAAGQRVLAAQSDFDGPRDLYLVDAGRPGEMRRLTRLNADLLAGVDLPRVHELAIRGADGQAVEGWFLEPTTGTAPRPAVLYIHGGPHGAFGHQFHADMQLLAGAGYGVVLANHRASTGYGQEFATGIRGEWGTHDYTDLMAAVDRAVELGLADPQRLGVCGLSGGGNLTCWIVGHTDRFKAAVPENPVTSFLSMFGVQDMGLWFGPAETGGLPHEIPEVYARMSPLTSAHRCTTPTLLVQGEGDMRCPPEQSEQFYAALTAAGCPVEMLRLPGMPHAGAIVGPLPIRRAQNQALIEWMDRWILGEAAPRREVV